MSKLRDRPDPAELRARRLERLAEDARRREHVAEMKRKRKVQS